MTNTWLPHPPLKERREEFVKILTTQRRSERLRLSEFLQPANILFFETEKDRTVIADALLQTFRGCDLETARQAIWRREGDLPLRLSSSNVVILRGRLPTLHHLQAALAMTPHAKTPVTVLFMGPLNQNRLHAGMLVAISSLFSRRRTAHKIARCKTPEDLLKTLRTLEVDEPSQPFLRSLFKRVWESFLLHYSGIAPSEEPF